MELRILSDDGGVVRLKLVGRNVQSESPPSRPDARKWEFTPKASMLLMAPAAMETANASIANPIAIPRTFNQLK